MQRNALMIEIHEKIFRFTQDFKLSILPQILFDCSVESKFNTYLHRHNQVIPVVRKFLILIKLGCKSSIINSC